MLALDKALIRNKATVLRDADRVCFNKENGCVLQLNDIGYALILHFEASSSVQNVLNSFANIFGGTDSFRDGEIVDFIDRLMTLEMLAEDSQ